jgi:hypothetical protein
MQEAKYKNQRIGATMVLDLIEKGEYTLENGTRVTLKEPFCACPDPISYIVINLDEKEREKYEQLYEDPYMQTLVADLEAKMNVELKRRKGLEKTRVEEVQDQVESLHKTI